MFKKKTTEPTALDKALDEAYTHLASFNPESDEHAAITKQIVELEKIRDARNKGSKISPDTIALIAANLVGIVLILNFEKAGVITSKAMGMVGKLR